MATLNINHRDNLYVPGRDGGFFMAYSIEGFFAERQAELPKLAARYPGTSLGQPLAWEHNLEDYRKHNQELGSPNYGLIAHGIIIASDGLTMQQRFAQRGETLTEAAFGDTVTLEGKTFRLERDWNRNAKFVPVA